MTLPLTRSRSQELRDTNQRLRDWLDSTISIRGQLAPATPECITALLAELLHAGAGLREQAIPAKGIDPEFDGELEEYRRNIEKLRDFLPSIHTQLLVERARLEAQRACVRSASEWAQASRRTL
jgi:hypothetical protein